MRRMLIVCASQLVGGLSVAQNNPATLSLSEDFTRSPPAVCGVNNQAPDPRCVLGKWTASQTFVGTKTLYDNEQLAPGHYSSTSGPCIVVKGSNVEIIGSEIGPCGAPGETSNFGNGIEIRPNGTIVPKNIKILHNVIHDVATGVLTFSAIHPIYVQYNNIFNSRSVGFDSTGYLNKGHLIQLANVSGGDLPSLITCNVSDGYQRYPALVGPNSVDDHISLYNVKGPDIGGRVEVAYNRIRGTVGGGTRQGSGIMVGDGPSSGNADNGRYWIHDNRIVQVNNTGIGVAGGSDITIERNEVDQRGPGVSSLTGWSFATKNNGTAVCTDIFFYNNLSAPANMWSYPIGQQGAPQPGIYMGPGCNVTFPTGNVANSNDVQSATLMLVNPAEGSEDTFRKQYSQCD